MASNGPFKFLVVGEPAEAVRLRVELRKWLDAAAITGLMRAEITSSVSEAFINAVEHPVDRAGAEITVEGEIDRREVEICVRDRGRWNERVDPTRDHNGLRLMEAQMDSVEVERTAEGTAVTLRRTV